MTEKKSPYEQALENQLGIFNVLQGTLSKDGEAKGIVLILREYERTKGMTPAGEYLTRILKTREFGAFSDVRTQFAKAVVRVGSLDQSRNGSLRFPPLTDLLSKADDDLSYLFNHVNLLYRANSYKVTGNEKDGFVGTNLTAQDIITQQGQLQEAQAGVAEALGAVHMVCQTPWRSRYEGGSSC